MEIESNEYQHQPQNYEFGNNLKAKDLENKLKSLLKIDISKAVPLEKLEEEILCDLYKFVFIYILVIMYNVGPVIF